MKLPPEICKWAITGYEISKVINSDIENKMEIVYIMANLMLSEKLTDRDIAEINLIIES